MYKGEMKGYHLEEQAAVGRPTADREEDNLTDNLRSEGWNLRIRW